MDDFLGLTRPAQTGWVYRVPLTPHTPLVELEQHGRQIPIDGLQVHYGVHGRWYETWSERPWAPNRPRMLSSFIGPVGEDGGDVRLFLIEFRRIIEDEQRPVRDRVAAVAELLTDPVCARFARALPADMSTSWVVDRIARAGNIGHAAACELVRLGLIDLADIAAASDSHLLAVRGIGQKTLASMRLALRDHSR